MMTAKTQPKHSILLVDDEPEILFSIKGLLRREFKLYTAESGAEALEILNQHPIHVVMTDQRMPKMTGVELMGKVKNEYPDAIRMVFTGYADIKAVIDAINKGGLFRYITKPWDPDELVDVIREAAAEYDRLVERRQLLTDLHEHVEQGQRYAERMLAPSPDVDAEGLNRFTENATQLLSRLQSQR
ncbi:response regulator [Rhodopirellula sp. JC639]|uniref:response regulator n=1 Tax=Stieleria mannarensis TaxID=2755585 RepID=UPI001C71A5CD|nr:response regulator [Rhodopirellula sp. JC639]